MERLAAGVLWGCSAIMAIESKEGGIAQQRLPRGCSKRGLLFAASLGANVYIGEVLQGV